MNVVLANPIPVICALILSIAGCASRSELPGSRRDQGPAAEGPGVTPEPAAGPAAGVRVLIEGPRYFRQGTAAIEYRIDGPGPVDRVQLWTTTNRGREWELAGEDPDRISPLELKAPDGEYGIWIAGAAKDGPPPAAPRAGDPPPATIVIDSVPPEVGFGEAKALRLRTSPGRLGIELPFTVSDRNPDPSAVRLEWRAGDDRWVLVPVEAAAVKAGRLGFSVPEASADPLSLRLTAADLAGNTSSRIEELHPLEQVDPPRLELLSLDDGGIYRGGSTVEVRFSVEWKRALPGGITLSSSIDGGRSWQPLAAGLHPQVPFSWKLPAIDSNEVVLELSARGACGFRAVRRSRPFRLDASPPAARILGPSTSRGRLVRLQVRAQDQGPAGLDHLDLYEALPEGGARKVREFPPGEGIEFETTLSGEVGLWLVAWDRAGNSSSLPAKDDPPSFVLEVETPQGPASPGSPGAEPAGEGPVLSLLNFQRGICRGGDRRYIFWSLAGALPDDTTLDIEGSGDGGKTWSRIASSLRARDGQWAWTLPREPGTARPMRLGLSASAGGKALSARSETDFVVESRLPRVEFRGPRASRSPRTSIAFSILPPLSTPGAEAPAPTAVSRVECWLRREGDPRWTLAGKATFEAGEGMPDGEGAPARGPAPAGDSPAGKGGEEGPEAPAPEEKAGRSLAVFVEDGRYEVFLLAEDAVGNRPDLPEGDGHGPRLLVDTIRPRLAITVEEPKDIYLGGEVVAVRIQAEDENLGEFPVKVEAAEGPPSRHEGKGSPGTAGPAEGRDEGEGWSVLSRWFPRNGTFSYTVPREAGERRIRIGASDLAGNRSERLVRFAVAPPAPRARLLGLDRPVSVRGGEPLVIRWETSGIGSPDGSEGKVALRSSRDGGRTWMDIVRPVPNGGVYTWTTPGEDIPDLRIRIEATGAAGQPASAESAPITVSARVPRVTLESVEPAPARPGTGNDRSAPRGAGEESSPP